MPFLNYHNHTELCGHASGSLDEYITAAVKRGITEIGFSDHAPMPLPMREGITMSPEQAEVYIENILKKKEEYRGIIEVKLGFEVDFPLHDTFEKEYFSDTRIDYLIGSCHYLDNWPFDHDLHIEGFGKKTIDAIYLEYFSELERLVDSRLFDIVGHFDLIKKFGHRAVNDMSPVIEKIAKKMSMYGTVCEINTSGLLKPVAEIYPSYDIIQILFNNNVPITLGSDSHFPDQVGYMFSEVSEQLKKIGYRSLSGFTGRVRHEVEF